MPTPCQTESIDERAGYAVLVSVGLVAAARGTGTSPAEHLSVWLGPRQLGPPALLLVAAALPSITRRQTDR